MQANSRQTVRKAGREAALQTADRMISTQTGRLGGIEAGRQSVREARRHEAGRQAVREARRHGGR
jgi:hypothetical protein